MPLLHSVVHLLHHSKSTSPWNSQSQNRGPLMIFHKLNLSLSNIFSTKAFTWGVLLSSVFSSCNDDPQEYWKDCLIRSIKAISCSDNLFAAYITRGFSHSLQIKTPFTVLVFCTLGEKGIPWPGFEVTLCWRDGLCSFVVSIP